MGKQGGSPAQHHGSDHAVDHPPRGHTCAAATAVDVRGAVEVGHHLKGQQLEPQQQPPQVGFPLITARPGEHLHDDGLGDRDRATRWRP